MWKVPRKKIILQSRQSRIRNVGEIMANYRSNKSNFLKVKCVDCGNQQVVFDHAASNVKCIICGKTLVKPKGGKSEITAQIVEVMD